MDKEKHLSFILVEMIALVVWNETSMNNRCCFETWDHSLRVVLENGRDSKQEKPFIGKSILLRGISCKFHLLFLQEQGKRLSMHLLVAWLYGLSSKPS